LIQTPDGYLGWLDNGAFVEVDSIKMLNWRLAKKVVVTKSFDLILANWNNTSDIISDVVEGDILESGDSADKYLKVILPDGRSGYISNSSVINYADFISIRESLLENILTTAHQMMGRPYLWGGTSGKGMDCSGFTKTIYYLNGLELPRDASQQVQVGMEIKTDSSLNNLISGDFIFFGTPGTDTQKEKISHVAMYLGDGKMIHASDRIQIESLKKEDPDFTERRLKTMVRAKRMLQNIGENGVKKLADHPSYMP
jgi:cell wall-associated NlpC family hydrolase